MTSIFLTPYFFFAHTRIRFLSSFFCTKDTKDACSKEQTFFCIHIFVLASLDLGGIAPPSVVLSDQRLRNLSCFFVVSGREAGEPFTSTSRFSWRSVSGVCVVAHVTDAAPCCVCRARSFRGVEGEHAVMLRGVRASRGMPWSGRTVTRCFWHLSGVRGFRSFRTFSVSQLFKDRAPSMLGRPSAR